MAVEDLVVDDEDVRERVDVLAVAGDHGRAPLRRPPLDLTRPVHLHDVRHDRQQRVRIGDGCRQHRLRRLAESGLVGEEERPVPFAHGFEEPGLVHHDLGALGREPVELGLRGQLHRGMSAARARLERLVERAHELPAVQAATGRLLRRAGGQIGCEERIGHLPRLDRGRDHLALGERGRHDVRGLRRDVRDDQFVGCELGPRFEQPVAAHAPGHGTCGLVDLEELDQRRVARGGLREDGGDAVQALEELGASGVGEGRVGLHAGALFAHQEGDHLELDPVGGAEFAPLSLRLHFAHLAREDGDDRRLVVAARRRGLPATLRRRPLGGSALRRRALGCSCRGRHAPPERVYRILRR